MNYIYDNKYIKNDFVKQLEKIDTVYIPEIPYTHMGIVQLKKFLFLTTLPKMLAIIQKERFSF